jgi:hypothetical protein
LEELAVQWRGVVARLRQARTAHGDLQHGNILVNSQKQIRLVDYDGFFIPTLHANPPQESGHPNYQHPERLQRGYYAENADAFAALVIYLSLRALHADPTLWTTFHTGENLIFKAADFVQPGRTPIWSRVQNSSAPEVRQLATALAEYCRGAVAAVPNLEAVLQGLSSHRGPVVAPPKVIIRKALGGAVFGALGGALVGGVGGSALNLGSIQLVAICGAIWGAMGGAVKAQRAALSAPQYVCLGCTLASILVGAFVGALASAVFAFTMPVKPLVCFGLFGRMSDLTLLGILTGAIVVALRGAFPWEVVSFYPRISSRLWNGLRGAGWGIVVGLITSVTVGAVWQAAVMVSDTGSMGLAIQEAIQGAGWGIVRGPLVGLVSGAIVGTVEVSTSGSWFSQSITQMVKPFQGAPFRLALVFVGLALLVGFLGKFVSSPQGNFDATQADLCEMLTYAMTRGGVDKEVHIIAVKERIKAHAPKGLSDPSRKKQADVAKARGRVAWHKGRVAEAVHAFQDAYNADPTDPKTVENLGIMYREQGNLKLAARYLLQALVLQPESFEAWLNLGRIYATQGHLREAVGCFAHAYRYGKEKAWEALEKDRGNHQYGKAARQALKLQMMQESSK